MSQQSKNVSLFVGLSLMGLAAWSALAAAAEKGSATCAAEVSAELNALAKKSGDRRPSGATQEKLLFKCSEAQVGLMLEGLASKHTQEGGTKPTCCVKAGMSF
jgi:hypothetical protein